MDLLQEYNSEGNGYFGLMYAQNGECWNEDIVCESKK